MSIITGFAQRLLNADVAGEHGVWDLVKKFNNSNGAGFSLGTERQSGGSHHNTMTIYKNGKRASNPILYEKISDPTK